MTVLRRAMRYLLPEFLADLNTGHNIRATVFVQCGAMYRAEGPEAFKPVGETEFVNGVAAMSASGTYGSIRACAGIVGHVDLTAGAAVSEVLEAHMKTAAAIGFAAFAIAPPTTPTPPCWVRWCASAPGCTDKRRFAKATHNWPDTICRSMRGCSSRSCPN